MMDMYPVVSKAIAKAGYDEASRVLRVEFTNGKIHDYAQVMPAWFEEFCKAESKGRFLVAVLKDPRSYPTRRITHNFGRKHKEDLCLDCGCAKEKINSDAPCQEWKINDPAF